MSAPATIVDVRGVDVELGGRRILTDVNFSVRSGDFTGLIGSNGAGKTTLLRLMLGLVQPTQGEVVWPSHAREQRRVGYVPQKVALDVDVPLRVRDFVALGDDGHRYGLRRRTPDTWRRVHDVLDAVEASDLAERRIGALSGGELQRVLMAHALVSAPELLLLDEPLANLDPGATEDIVSLLARVREREHVAILLSAHDINSLLGVMDRVVYIANAHVASGPTDEVVRPDVLSKLYGHHVDVVRVHGRFLVVTGTTSQEPVAEHPDLVVE
ncbi:MAG: metal ABC transporter ATP-binding protein [Acidobacteria bacterium]|nr:metal ABC transporter ATP-binding protein [Acidobacteriota bacterium]